MDSTLEMRTGKSGGVWPGFWGAQQFRESLTLALGREEKADECGEVLSSGLDMLSWM